VFNPLVLEFIANFKGTECARVVCNRLQSYFISESSHIIARNAVTSGQDPPAQELSHWDAMVQNKPLPDSERLVFGSPSSVFFDQIFGHNPLLFAAYVGHSEAIDFFYKISSVQGRNKIFDLAGDGPLHYAVYGASEAGIPKILDSGFEINSRNSNGQTALHLSVIRESVTVARKLLECGAAPTLRDAQGSSPLHYAVAGHRDDLVAILMMNGADPAVKDSNGMNVFHLAAQKGSIGALQVLLDEKFDLASRVWILDEVCDSGQTAIHYASMQPNEECLEILLIAGANPTIASENTRETALHITSSKANFASLRILLKKSTLYEDNWINFADLKGNTMLHNLIFHIENDTSSRSSTLVSSVGSLIQLAITHGADITIENEAGKSAFDLCSDPNSKDAFKLKRILERAHQKFAKQEKPLRKTSNNAISTTPLNNHSQIKMCEVCTENQIDVIMLPCNHMFCCTTCSLRIKKCMVCKELVDDKITIPKLCYLCEETPPTIQFTPCFHVLLCQSCSSTPKSCIKCRIPIMSKTSIFSCSQSSNQEINNASLAQSIRTLSITKNNPKGSTNTDLALRTLQGKYQELRDRVICVICLDNVMNMVFLCGHGSCQMCGDRCSDCPICRKRIERKILLYC